MSKVLGKDKEFIRIVSKNTLFLLPDSVFEDTIVITSENILNDTINATEIYITSDTIGIYTDGLDSIIYLQGDTSGYFIGTGNSSLFYVGESDSTAFISIMNDSTTSVDWNDSTSLEGVNHIFICNLEGKKVLSVVSANFEEIDLSKLNAGLYQIIVFDKNGNRFNSNFVKIK